MRKMKSRKKASAGASLAVYAGTFDPITNGHLDIIERALNVFSEIHVSVVIESKKQTWFTAEERVELVREVIKGFPPASRKRVAVGGFEGLLVEHVRSLGARVIIRGLRAVSDYEYEAQMAIINRHLAEDVETVFLMTSDHCSFISSSVVREISRNGGDVSGLVPPAIVRTLSRLSTSRR